VHQKAEKGETAGLFQKSFYPSFRLALRLPGLTPSALFQEFRKNLPCSGFSVDKDAAERRMIIAGAGLFFYPCSGQRAITGKKGITGRRSRISVSIFHCLKWLAVI
jgi:hypothetical protein